MATATIICTADGSPSGSVVFYKPLYVVIHVEYQRRVEAIT